MALLDPTREGAIEAGLSFTLRIAGAESNFGVALARLGVSVTWISRLGADPFGDVVYKTLMDEGLDLRHVRREPGAPTGVFFKWREGGASRVVYYRRGSAASLLGPTDVPDDALDDVSLVHLTGITMALSGSARDLVVELAARARKSGAIVLFDPNYRPALWRGPQEAAVVQREVLPLVDWYLCGFEEGGLLFGSETCEDLLEELAKAGIENAVVRIGSRGAVVASGEGRAEVRPAHVRGVADEIGAGDGFAAGFAYGLLNGWEPVACVQAGNAIAATALAGTGDWETFPRLEEIEDELATMRSGALVKPVHEQGAR
jgi:2-dehydro-3-deoxygluconokinase